MLADDVAEGGVEVAGLLANAASPRRSVSAVESAMSAKRMAVIPDDGAATPAGWPLTPTKSAIARAASSVSTNLALGILCASRCATSLDLSRAVVRSKTTRAGAAMEPNKSAGSVSSDVLRYAIKSAGFMPER